MQYEILRLPIERPAQGLEWSTKFECPVTNRSLEVGGCGWTSRRSGAIALPDYSGQACKRLGVELGSPVLLSKIELYGVFALGDSMRRKGDGDSFALSFLRDGRLMTTVELKKGLHIIPNRSDQAREDSFGDGGRISTVGSVDVGSQVVAVDMIAYEFEKAFHCDRIVFSDETEGCCAVLFDVVAYHAEVSRCPFRDSTKGVPFAEIPKIVRLADVRKFYEVSGIVEEAILDPVRDLDDAKGMALTHLAMVCAAGLETGASDRMHRVQLDSAREIDKCTTLKEVARTWRGLLDEVVVEVMPTTSSRTDALIDKAVEFIHRNYASTLEDEDVARRLGLSTSHFRHLFKLRTKKPFRKYLQTVRLERSKDLLMKTDLPVSAIAKAVGFASPAHFTRAIQAHFGAPPSALRRRAAQ